MLSQIAFRQVGPTMTSIWSGRRGMHHEIIFRMPTSILAIIRSTIASAFPLPLNLMIVQLRSRLANQVNAPVPLSGSMNETSAMRCLLVDVGGVTQYDGPMMSLNEMRAYLHGRITHERNRLLFLSLTDKDRCCMQITQC